MPAAGVSKCQSPKAFFSARWRAWHHGTHGQYLTRLWVYPNPKVPCAGGKAPLAAGAGERQALHRAAECALACAGSPAAAPPRLLAAAVLFLGCAADGEQVFQGSRAFLVQHRCVRLLRSLLLLGSAADSEQQVRTLALARLYTCWLAALSPNKSNYCSRRLAHYDVRFQVFWKMHFRGWPIIDKCFLRGSAERGAGRERVRGRGGGAARGAAGPGARRARA